MAARWHNAWVRAHAAAGGWSGPATLRALRPRAEELRALGLTTRAAGNVTAREYNLHRAAADCRELAGLEAHNG